MAPLRMTSGGPSLTEPRTALLFPYTSRTGLRPQRGILCWGRPRRYHQSTPFLPRLSLSVCAAALFQAGFLALLSMPAARIPIESRERILDLHEIIVFRN